MKLFSLKLFSLKLFSLKLFSLKLFSLKLFSSPPPTRTLGTAPPLFGFAQAEPAPAVTPPGTYAGDLQVFDAEDPPGVRGSPGRGDPNTAHYARVEGESTKGAPSQKSGDRYTEDPPGVRGSPGRGDQNTARPGSSTDPAPEAVVINQSPLDWAIGAGAAVPIGAGAAVPTPHVSGISKGFASTRRPPPPPQVLCKFFASSTQVLRKFYASSTQVLRKFYAPGYPTSPMCWGGFVRRRIHSSSALSADWPSPQRRLTSASSTPGARRTTRDAHASRHR